MRGFVGFIGKSEQIDAAAARGLLRHAVRERHFAGVEIGCVGKAGCEGVVDPVHHRGVGTEIGVQFDNFQWQCAELPVADELGEDPHIGLAKGVDRLLWIADQKQRAAVARLPAFGELLQQGDLAGRGVLHFIDQQMADLGIALEQGLAVAAVGAQRLAGSQRHFDKVGRAAPAHHQAVVRQQVTQDDAQVAAQHRQRRAEARRRQGQQAHGGGFEVGVAFALGDQRLHQLMLGCSGLEAGVRFDAARLAQGLVGFGDQGAGEMTIKRVLLRIDGRPAREVQRPGEVRVVGRGQAQGFEQTFGVAAEHVAEALLRLALQLDQQGQRCAVVIGGTEQVAAPLVAALHQLHQRLREAVEAVVHRGQQAAGGREQFGVGLGSQCRVEHAVDGGFDQAARVVAHGQPSAQAGEQRQLGGNGGVQAIDGLRAQPRRGVGQGPAQCGVAGAHRFGEREMLRGIVIARRRRGGVGQCGQHAVANLGGGLGGEGDGHHLLGPVAGGQRRQKALHQQAGLAGSGGRDGHHVAVQPQGACAGGLVGRGHGVSSPSSSTSGSTRSR